MAKELGVKSPAIVQKCHDEGLDVKNHMSTISAGLAATIREWFSEGDNVTTVETTEKVDLKKVRVRKKAKRKRVPKATEAEIKVEEPAALEVSESAVAVVAETAAEEEVPKGPQIVEHPEPEPVVPAGPLLEKPAPAQLSGPKVIRVEEPEDLRPAKPKPRLRYDAPVTEPLMYDESELVPEKGADSEPKKGSPGHRKDRTHGRRSEQVAGVGRRSRPTGSSRR